MLFGEPARIFNSFSLDDSWAWLDAMRFYFSMHYDRVSIALRKWRVGELFQIFYIEMVHSHLKDTYRIEMTELTE